jgi:hypothetical protein
MSDTTTSETPPQEGSETPEPKTYDAEYVAKLRNEAAKYRTEAKANATAAERLAAIEEANKTEAQKLADRAAAAEAERDAARVEVLRFKIAAAHGLSEDDADLFLTGTDEETLTKQAKRLSDREGDRRKSGNHVPREGTTTTAPPSDQREFARELFGAP